MNRLVRFRWAILLFFVVIFLRIPSYFEPHWYGDEDIYLTIGNVLNQGGRLYTDVIDHKPPLLYWLTASLGTLQNLKIFLSLWLAVGVIGLDALMRKLDFSSLSRWVALGIFILFSTLPTFEGNVFNAELLFIPLTIWGMLFLWSGLVDDKKSFYLVASGACFSIATLFKIPAVFDFIAALITIGVFAFRQKLSIIKFSLGFGVPIIIVTSILFIQGNFFDFLRYAIGYNFQYMDDWSSVQQSPLITFLASWGVRGGILIGVCGLIWILARRQLSFKHQMILTWFWLSLFGTLLSLRPYAHYFLQLLPSISLLAGLIITKKTRIFQKSAFLLSLLTVWLLIHYLPVELFRTRGYYDSFFSYTFQGLPWKDYASWFHGGILEQYQLTEWINSHSTQQDKLFVWGNVPILYAQTKTFPATRFVTDYHIWSFRGFDEVYAALESTPPQFIADCRLDLQDFPQFRDILLRYSPVYQTENCKLFSYSITDQMLQ